MSAPLATVAALVVDCDDPLTVAAFWQAMLGGETVRFDEYGVVALRAPGVTFDFVRAPGPTDHKNRWHLDLATDDPAATVAKAIALGATEAPDVGGSDRFTVMRDVEGHEFCIMNYSVAGPWVPPEL